MKVSSAKLKTKPDISFAYPLLSPMWLPPQHGYATTFSPIAQFCCIILYSLDQGSLPLSLCKLALDLYPKTHNSRHERSDTIISSSLTLENIMKNWQCWWKGQLVRHFTDVFNYLKWPNVSRIQLPLLTKSHHAPHWRHFQKYLITDLEF